MTCRGELMEYQSVNCTDIGSDGMKTMGREKKTVILC